MKTISISAFLFLLSMSFTCLGQGLRSLPGKVLTSGSLEPVAGASIKVRGTSISLATDSSGSFLIKVAPGQYRIDISAINALKLSTMVTVKSDTIVFFEVQSSSNDLDEVTVASSRSSRSLSTTQMGADRISMETVRKIPHIFGERDILKAIQLLPGVKSAGEGGSGFYVRGGATDQNLILLDDVPVYNASHLLGFFSTFNSDAVDYMTLYKTGMPAEFGGRISSVLDINMKDGNRDHFSASGGIGLISSKIAIEAPIQTGKSSFIVAARRTYLDALLKLSPDSSINQNVMHFYDVNAKADYQLNDRTRLSFTGFLGSDELGLSDLFGVSWGNALASLKLQHQISPIFSFSTTGAFTRYSSRAEIDPEANSVSIYSQINDLSLKQAFTWQQGKNNLVRFGLNSIYHTVTPGEITAAQSANINSVNYQKRYSWENALYANSDYQLTGALKTSIGLRLNAFSVLGPGNFNTVDDAGTITSTANYPAGGFAKTYINVEPRIALSYLINERSSLKSSYVRNTQNMHMIGNSTSGRPTDRWISSTTMIKPEISDQYSIGYYRNLFDNRLELNVESYYKSSQNQIDYRDGADITDADAIETQLLYGKGRAYGLEVLLRKNTGRFTGWIAYTLSRTERQIDGISQGKWYNARQDRTHDISIVGAYEVSKKLTLSATWIYYTGDAVTFPAGKYNMDGQSFFYYTDRNTYRMPAYHRLDLGATLQLRKRRNYTSELAFSLYNAYGRKNPYSITFRESENDPTRTEAVRTTLFQFLPSISYNFKFR